ncbi:MAG: hypothetical protein OHK006_20540 [Thermodesulfovibrionales bacterium]
MRFFSFPLLTGLLFIACACGAKPADYPHPKAEGGKVIIPLSEVADGKAHFYTYRAGGKQVNFFVRTADDGTVSAHFDACFTCYKKKKGYRLEDDNLVCNECAMTFPLGAKEWDSSQGCSPILLKSKIEENRLVIETELLDKGARLFQ